VEAVAAEVAMTTVEATAAPTVEAIRGGLVGQRSEEQQANYEKCS